MIAKSSGFLFVVAFASVAVSESTIRADPPNAADRFDEDAVIRAFTATSQGYSSDELLVRQELRDAFLEHVRSGKTLDADAQRAAFLTLLRLRKAGKLGITATRRGSPVNDELLPVAEIAARVVTDRHRITSDTMLADPTYRGELLREAEKISPGVSSDDVAKAVLALRKKRALRPELVLQVAQWPRQVVTYTLDELRGELVEGHVSHEPGVYLFRSRDQYLYIGEAQDLSHRLSAHLRGSDRQSLANYLAGEGHRGVTVEIHAFPKDSPGGKAKIRRAYESELIRSRRPRFNVRP